MDAYHRVNLHLIRPFSGAIDALHRLRDGGVQLAIWTGRDRSTTVELLAAHALNGLFGAVVCGDDLPTHKPDPAGLYEIVRQLGVVPAETLFVGDADVDVLGGVAAGIPTVLIRHGREISATIAAQSSCVVATPMEAFQLISDRVDNTVTPN
jgi:phosphoglycolate phosphatase